MAGRGFGFGGLGNILKQAQQVQQGAQKLQEELEQLEIEGKNADETVTVVMSGNQEPKRVEIAPEALERGAEALSAAVTEAMQSAYAQSTEQMKERMESLTSGLKLPGMG